VATRRRFTEEYKDQAVSLHLDSGRSIAEVARSIGVHEMTPAQMGEGRKRQRPGRRAMFPAGIACGRMPGYPDFWHGIARLGSAGLGLARRGRRPVYGQGAPGARRSLTNGRPPSPGAAIVLS